MSREYTKQECVDMFMEYVMSLVSYWANVEGSKEWVLHGLLHSILVVFDGEAAALPAFDLVPSPHPDDKQYHIDNGENYWPEDMHMNDETYLHDIMKRYE